MATGNVPITAGSGTPIRIVTNAGVDSGADQQIVTLADDAGAFLAASALPAGVESGVYVRAIPAKVTRQGFSKAISGGVDTTWASVVATGSGQTVNQTNSNLVLTTGTTANSETIIRSLANFSGGVRLRARSTLSQRIANQNFFVELVDVIQDAASITINSATAVTVTFTTNPFTSANVGQFMYLGAYSGSGTFVPGRYTIASVSGSTVTYTVAGFAAGSGTCSVFGWNYHHLVYSGTTATAAGWDTQRNGWNTGDTTLAINTTASPGHLAVLSHNDMQAYVMDALVATTAGAQFTPRGSRLENVPDDTALFLQIRVANGSAAPASTTTWTIGQAQVTNWAAQDVVIQDLRPQASMSALPTQVVNTPNVAVTNTPAVTATLNAGTNSIGYLGTGTVLFATSAATTNAALVKSGAGAMYSLVVCNLSASTVYVKLYNKTTAPTVGTDLPVMVFTVAAAATFVQEFGVAGSRFNTGIGIALTGAVANDTTVAAAGALVSLTYN